MVLERRQHELEGWWDGLSEAQRAELLPLREGDVLPHIHFLGLSVALGGGPSGVKWERDGFIFRADSGVAAFLEQKRRQERRKRKASKPRPNGNINNTS
jgi:hypothetical protein